MKKIIMKKQFIKINKEKNDVKKTSKKIRDTKRNYGKKTIVYANYKLSK